MNIKNLLSVLVILLILGSCQTSQKHVAFGTGQWKQDVNLSSTRQHLSTSSQIQSSGLDNHPNSNSLGEIHNITPIGETTISNGNDESKHRTNPVTTAAVKELKDIENTNTYKELNFLEKIAVKKAIKPIKKMAKENKSSTNYTETKLTDSEFIIALFLLIFLGALGIHRFYLGYTLWGY